MQEASVLEGTAAGVRERLLTFVREVVAGLPHVRQRDNALLYVRALVEHGGRKSLQPTLLRLKETPARYESMQQFLADSPWDPSQLVRAAAERVYPHLGVTAWVIDDTGIPKDGTHSPGVKRQYSGTLGKIGNCQIAVSVHAVGERGTVPLGWALYLPEEWCRDRAPAPEGQETRQRRGFPRRTGSGRYDDDEHDRTTLTIKHKREKALLRLLIDWGVSDAAPPDHCNGYHSCDRVYLEECRNECGK